MKRVFIYLPLLFAFILSSACSSGAEAQPTPTQGQVPTVEEDAPASAETSGPVEEKSSGNWIRLEFSTSSDWADLYIITPDQILSYENVSLIGDPSDHMVKTDHLMLDQGIDAAESGSSVGITVDFELGAPLEELVLDFRSHRGGLNESYVRIFDLRGDQRELILEVDHTLSNDDQGILDFSLGIREEAQVLSEESSQEDRIFFNGTILTMEDGAVASAILVKEEFILAVGSDEDILALAHPGTDLIDLEGRTLMPGFVDPHSHIFNNWQGDPNGAQRDILSKGITAYGEMSPSEEVLRGIVDLEKSGNLRLRVSLYPTHVDNCGTVFGSWYLEEYPPSKEPGATLQIPGVKLFNDGGSCNSPASSYTGTDDQGDLYFNVEELSAMLIEIQNNGYQAAIHSLGDRAINVTQQAIGIALDGGPNILRHRIEHNGILPDELIPVYSEYDINALIFGNFPTCYFNGGASKFKGRTPLEYIYLEWRYRPLVDANPNVHFAWHADSPPIGPQDPFLHLHGFVTRIQYLDDGTVCEPQDWAADDLFTVEEALSMMTIEGAYALQREDELGSLKEGKLADLIILSDNPLEVEPADILNIQVLMTMVGGQVEHCAGGYESFCPNFP